MKIVGFVPYWLDYRTDNKEHRNLKKLGGQYLINYSVRLLGNTSMIDTTYIYSSSKRVLEYIDSTLSYTYLDRPPSLDSDSTSIEDIIDAFLNQCDADIVVLLHPNSPFLQAATVGECIEKVVSGEYDSALTALKMAKLAWFNGKPLNYVLSKPIPKLSEITPVILEQASLYVFTKDTYLSHRKRIGDTPFFKWIDHFEGHEINCSEDFQVAELIVNAGMYREL